MLVALAVQCHGRYRSDSGRSHRHYSTPYHYYHHHHSSHHQSQTLSILESLLHILLTSDQPPLDKNLTLTVKCTNQDDQKSVSLLEANDGVPSNMATLKKRKKDDSNNTCSVTINVNGLPHSVATEDSLNTNHLDRNNLENHYAQGDSHTIIVNGISPGSESLIKAHDDIISGINNENTDMEESTTEHMETIGDRQTIIVNGITPGPENTINKHLDLKLEKIIPVSHAIKNEIPRLEKSVTENHKTIGLRRATLGPENAIKTNSHDDQNFDEVLTEDHEIKNLVPRVEQSANIPDNLKIHEIIPDNNGTIGSIRSPVINTTFKEEPTTPTNTHDSTTILSKIYKNIPGTQEAIESPTVVRTSPYNMQIDDIIPGTHEVIVGGGSNITKCLPPGVDSEIKGPDTMAIDEIIPGTHQIVRGGGTNPGGVSLGPEGIAKSPNSMIIDEIVPGTHNIIRNGAVFIENGVSPSPVNNDNNFNLGNTIKADHDISGGRGTIVVNGISPGFDGSIGSYNNIKRYENIPGPHGITKTIVVNGISPGTDHSFFEYGGTRMDRIEPGRGTIVVNGISPGAEGTINQFGMIDKVIPESQKTITGPSTENQISPVNKTHVNNDKKIDQITPGIHKDTAFSFDIIVFPGPTNGHDYMHIDNIIPVTHGVVGGDGSITVSRVSRGAKGSMHRSIDDLCQGENNSECNLYGQS